MSQQEMNYDSIHHEERRDFHQHDLSQQGQKIYPHNHNQVVALRIRLWTAYLSLALFFMIVAGGDSASLALLIVIMVNVLVALVVAVNYRR